MATANKQQVKIFHSLLHYAKMKEAKESLLAGCGVESTLDLDPQQIESLIDYLRGIIARKDEQITQVRRKHMHQCLKIMSQIGINTQDWEKVNGFMLNKHVCGRHLYELSLEELIAFKRKLYAIRKKINEKRADEQRLTRMN